MSDSDIQQESLFSEFDPTSTKEWENVLTRDLKGADYKKRLKWESIEGIEALPFYRREDLESLPHLANGVDINTPAEWAFCEVIDQADPADANRDAKKAIEKGADSLWLTIQFAPDDGELGGDVTGIRVQNLYDMNTLLDGIDLKKTGVVFNSGAGSVGILGLIEAYLEGIDLVTYTELTNDTPLTHSGLKHLSFLFDPFTYMAEHGRLPVSDERLNSLITQMAEANDGHTLTANGAFFHNSGATLIQEIGIALAIGSDYLARVPESDRKKVANRFWMHLSAGSLYFPEIAKFRAARLLWQRVLDAYGLDSTLPLTIHASTSQWNKAIADSHNNMLRATTEATAAAVGGANTITVHPYDIHYEQTDDFSQRIARNVSHILDEESHISAVENPGDGSYYIEVLTDEIARKAWDFFKLIEKQGGVQKALEANIIQGEVDRSSSMKQQALATRELVLTGVNHYPDPEQSLPDDLFRSVPKDSLHQTDEKPAIDADDLIKSLSKAFAKGARLGDVIDSFLSPQKQLYPALNTYRAAESFERLRLKTQQFSAQRGRNVTVQLVPVGHKKMRKARATFSQNFLGCAGFRVENHIGFDSVADAADGIAADKADILVLCGADHEYPELVPQFCDSFGDESILILAGHPKEHEEAFRDAGIDYFIYSGSNILETLQAIQIQLGMD